MRVSHSTRVNTARSYLGPKDSHLDQSRLNSSTTAQLQPTIDTTTTHEYCSNNFWRTAKAMACESTTLSLLSLHARLSSGLLAGPAADAHVPTYYHIEHVAGS